MSEDKTKADEVKKEDFDFSKFKSLMDIPEYRDLVHENMGKKEKIKELSEGQDKIVKEIDDMKEVKRLDEEEAAKKANDFQGLYAKSEERVTQLEEAKVLLEKKIVDDRAFIEQGQTMYEVEKEISFAKPKYKENFPIKDVHRVDGKIDADSLKRVCDQFKQNYPELIMNTGKAAVNTTGAAPIKNDNLDTNKSEADVFKTLAEKMGF